MITVSFEGKFHIFLIVSVSNISISVMEVQKINQSDVLILFFMLHKMLYQKRQLQQLIKFSSCHFIAQQNRYCDYFFQL